MVQQALTENDGRPAATDRTRRGMRLGVVRELLADLDTVTSAGITFTMAKVVDLLRAEIGVAEAALSDLHRRVIRCALDDLAREQDRLLPDADTFVLRTQMITDTLALV